MSLHGSLNRLVNESGPGLPRLVRKRADTARGAAVRVSAFMVELAGADGFVGQPIHVFEQMQSNYQPDRQARPADTLRVKRIEAVLEYPRVGQPG